MGAESCTFKARLGQVFFRSFACPCRRSCEAYQIPVDKPSPWHTPAFRALQTRWYARLRAEGFRDIESGGEDSRLLDGVNAQTLERATPARAEYYRRCRDFAHHYRRFERPEDQRIAELYAEGYTQQQIAAALGSRRTSVQWRLERKILPALERWIRDQRRWRDG